MHTHILTRVTMPQGFVCDAHSLSHILTRLTVPQGFVCDAHSPSHILTRLTETQGLICDEFIGREAVMEFHYVHILWSVSTLVKHHLGSLLGHVIANLGR